MQKLWKTAGRSAAILALLAAATFLFHGEAFAQQGSTGRTRVLVPPLEAGQNVNGGFGRNVAERVRDRIGDLNVLTAVTKDEMEDALDKFDLDADEMSRIQWRQLAGQVDAGLILFGRIEEEVGSGSDRYGLEVVFVDAQTGDELRAPSFTIEGSGGNARRAAADKIAQALDKQVEYLRSLAFCQDYYGADQYEDAVRNCNRALEISPDATQARMIRGQIYRQLASALSDSASSAEESSNPGEAARFRSEAEEQWQNAREDFRAVVDRNSANTDALQNLAYVNAQLGDTDRATELYREYLEFNPKDAQVRLSVAHNLAQAGAYGEAIAILQEGVEADSTNAALWQYMGDLALTRGIRGESAAAAQKKGAQVQDTASVQLAVRSYDRVLQLKKDSVSPSILRNTIAAHLQLGELEEALRFANRALEERPDDADLWSLKADVLAQQEKYAEAVATMESVIGADPDYPRAYFKRGLFRLRAGGSADSAITDFERAVESGTSGDMIAQQMLGVGYNDYWKNGQLERAIDMFQAGLEFAETGSDTAHQLEFFTAYGYYQQGQQIDKANTEEACGPARRALDRFRQVLPHLREAGSYQPDSQQQIRKSTEAYLFREKQVIKKACG